MNNAKSSIIFFVAILFFLNLLSTNFSSAYAQDNSNTITIKNQTEQIVLVKIIGSTNYQIEIPSGVSIKKEVAAGLYELLLRFGNEPKKYLYERGEIFSIEETDTSFTQATIILYKINDGNYQTEKITEKEFESELTGLTNNLLQIKREKKIPLTKSIPIIKKSNFPMVKSIPIIEPLVLPKVHSPKPLFTPLPKHSFKIKPPVFRQPTEFTSLKNINLEVNALQVNKKVITNIPHRDTLTAPDEKKIVIVSFSIALKDSIIVYMKNSDFAVLFENEAGNEIEKASGIANCFEIRENIIEIWGFATDTTTTGISVDNSPSLFKLAFCIPKDVNKFEILTKASITKKDKMDEKYFNTILAYCDLSNMYFENVIEIWNELKK